MADYTVPKSFRPVCFFFNLLLDDEGEGDTEVDLGGTFEGGPFTSNSACLHCRKIL